MQVFKIYFKLMKKQIISLILYGLMFISITLIITFAIILKDNGNFEVQKVPVLLINKDENNEFTDTFKTYLGNYVTFMDVEDDEEARKDSLFHHEVHYILTIPEGFTESFLKGDPVYLIKETLPDRQDSIQYVDNVVNSFLNMAGLYSKYNPEVDIIDLAEFMNTYNLPETEVIIDSKKKSNLDSTEFNKYYFNYLGYIIISCFILGISRVMMAFHNIDIRRRQFASPISYRSFNMQLILANMIFVLVYLIIYIALGYISNPYRRIDFGLILTWINLLLFSLTILCISYLIGITVKGKNAVQAFATMISISMAFISGMFVPQELLGNAVKRVSSFTPAFWYVLANNTISELQNFSIESISNVLQYMAIQIGFAAVFLSVILVVAKRKRQITE